jgi:hypothetical protein
MPATIKIKNSSTSGAVPTASDLVQGELAVNVADLGLYTENASGTVVKLNAPSIDDKGTGATKRLTIDTSGNMGLGVTPSAWGSSFRAFEILGGSIFSTSTQNIIYLQNAYNDGTGFKYKTSDTASQYRQANGAHLWYNAASGTAGNAITFTQAMTLDASGNLAIGNTSAINTASGRGNITLNGSSNVIYVLGVGGVQKGYLYHNGTDMAVENSANGFLSFATNATERARIDSSGNLLVGTTSTARTSNGIKLLPGTDDGTVSITNARSSGGNPIELNRQVSDGTLIAFYQADTLEGSISVSGTTVSYNGGHLARFAQTIDAKDESLKKGTVLSNLDEMNTYTDAEGNAVDNEQLNKVKVSDVEGDANVAGVFVNWSHDEDHNVDEINMAMTGDMIIRIAQGTTVARGDLLMSAGNGTAKPQGDDIVRAKTIAKVTSTHVTCTYEDGSYCVPCVLMAC